MAEDRDKLYISVITLVLLCVSLPWSGASQCLSNETYDHDGLRCCLCGYGRGLVKPCTQDLTHGTCEECGPDMFSSILSNQPCERCTSCSHENENLEEDVPCSPAQDRKCRCKADHYCVSYIEGCKLCHPCKQCGDLGVKVACSGRIDTVCNEPTQSGSNVAGIIAGVLIGLALLGAAAAAAVWYWQKRRSGQQVILTRSSDVEMQEPLTVPRVNLEPLLEDIAEVIGWTDMAHVAMRSGYQTAVIEGCQVDHPSNSQEQTIKLLKIWTQREGSDAGRKLLERLQQGSKKQKAEAVRKIIVDSSNGNPSSAGS